MKLITISRCERVRRRTFPHGLLFLYRLLLFAQVLLIQSLLQGKKNSLFKVIACALLITNKLSQ